MLLDAAANVSDRWYLDHHLLNCTCHCAAAAADGMCIDKASWQSATNSKVTAPSLTKLDKAFEAEGCQFVWGMSDLTVSDLNALFQKVICNIPSLTVMHNSSWLCWNQSLLTRLHTVPYNLKLYLPRQVGFPQRDPNRLQLALDNSHSVLWIRSMKQSRWARQGQLLGFARATSDGALSATIWDVAVSLLIITWTTWLSHHGTCPQCMYLLATQPAAYAMSCWCCRPVTSSLFAFLTARW